MHMEAPVLTCPLQQSHASLESKTLPVRFNWELAITEGPALLVTNWRDVTEYVGGGESAGD